MAAREAAAREEEERRRAEEEMKGQEEAAEAERQRAAAAKGKIMVRLRAAPQPVVTAPSIGEGSEGGRLGLFCLGEFRAWERGPCH